MKWRVLSLLFCITSLYLFPASADLLSDWRSGQTQTSQMLSTSALDALLRERAQTLPTVRMMEAQSQVIRQRASKMGILPDPSLTVEVMGLPWNTFRINQTPMSGIQVGLAWTLPWPGMRAADVYSEQMMADAMRAEQGEVALSAEVDAAKMYWQVHTIDRMLEALDPIEQQLRDMQQLAKARYLFGTAMESEVLRAGLALSDLGARRVEMLAMRGQMVAAFNAMLGLPPETPLVPTPNREISPIASLPSTDTLLSTAEQMRPAFDAFEAQSRAFDARENAADYGRYPMFMVGASYTFRMDSSVGGASHTGTVDQDGGVDFLGAMVGITLPFFSGGRVDAEQSAILAERHVVDTKRQETLWMLRADIANAYATLRGLEVRLQNLENSLKPDARSVFDTLVAIYPTGGSDFMDLLAASERILMLDMQRAQWVSEHHLTRDHILRLTQFVLR